MKRLLALSLCAVMLNGCIVDASVAPGLLGGSSSDNAPIVGVSSDGLGYSVSARSYSATAHYGPMLKTPSVAIAVSVIGFGGGSAFVEIRDANGSLAFTQTVTTNIAQANTVVRGAPPFSVTLTFSRFSGTFSLGVGAGN
jgi:hypothetical protein